MYDSCFTKKFKNYTNLSFVGFPPPTLPTGPKRGMWFLNNTPMHHIGALSERLITTQAGTLLA